MNSKQYNFISSISFMFMNVVIDILIHSLISSTYGFMYDIPLIMAEIVSSNKTIDYIKSTYTILLLLGYITNNEPSLFILVLMIINSIFKNIINNLIRNINYDDIKIIVDNILKDLETYLENEKLSNSDKSNESSKNEEITKKESTELKQQTKEHEDKSQNCQKSDSNSNISSNESEDETHITHYNKIKSTTPKQFSCHNNISIDDFNHDLNVLKNNFDNEIKSATLKQPSYHTSIDKDFNHCLNILKNNYDNEMKKHFSDYEIESKIENNNMSNTNEEHDITIDGIKKTIDSEPVNKIDRKNITINKINKQTVNERKLVVPNGQLTADKNIQDTYNNSNIRYKLPSDASKLCESTMFKCKIPDLCDNENSESKTETNTEEKLIPTNDKIPALVNESEKLDTSNNKTDTTNCENEFSDFDKNTIKEIYEKIENKIKENTEKLNEYKNKYEVETDDDKKYNINIEMGKLKIIIENDEEILKRYKSILNE